MFRPHGGDITDDAQVQFPEPFPGPGPDAREQPHRQRGEKGSFVPVRHVLQPRRPRHLRRDPADHFIGGDPERGLEAQSPPDFPPRLPGGVPRRAPEPAGSRDIQVGVTVTRGFEHRGVGRQDSAYRAGGPEVERFVRRQHDRVPAAAQRPGQRHPLADPRPPGLRGQGRHDGTRRGAGSDHHGAAAQFGMHHPFHGHGERPDGQVDDFTVQDHDYKIGEDLVKIKREEEARRPPPAAARSGRQGRRTLACTKTYQGVISCRTAGRLWRQVRPAGGPWNKKFDRSIAPSSDSAGSAGLWHACWSSGKNGCSGRTPSS